MGNRIYYFDEEKRQMVEGYPPQKFPKYGEAPIYISDEMKPYYHPTAQVTVTSKSKLKMIDKQCGTFTTDKYQSISAQVRKQKTAERRKDLKDAMMRAYNDVKNNNTPLSEEVKAKCKKNDEILSSQVGWDVSKIIKRNKR